MFEFCETAIAGLLEIRPRVARDERGLFVKTFHRDIFAARGLNTEYPEVYFSASRKGVVRGMHFQLPPHGHDKLVYCLSGQVNDVILDLRNGSPTFGKFQAFVLEGAIGSGLLIPQGCAHGFLSLTEESMLLYSVETVYSPDADAGVRWNSFGYDWPVEDPILSPRDISFVGLQEFQTPFVF